MTKRLDSESKGILEFRPNINFIQPDVGPGVILADEEPPQLEEITDRRQEVKQLAKAVNVLATTIQSMVDQKAKNMAIKIDPGTQPDAVSAMNRKFPDADPELITYEQYKQVKDDLRKLGEEIGKQALIDPSEVAAARDDADKAQQNLATDRASRMGGFDTEEAKNGGLRPELDARAMIIQPLDIPKIQLSLVCILANFIWKTFIKGVFPWPVRKALPDKICNPGGDIEIPGLFMLGDKKVPDTLSGKAAKDSSSNSGLDI